MRKPGSFPVFFIMESFHIYGLFRPFSAEINVSFQFLNIVAYPPWFFIQCRGQADLFLPNSKKKCLPTFQLSPHGVVFTRERNFFPFPFFGLSFTSAPYLTFFLLYSIFSLWVCLEVILHSLLHTHTLSVPLFFLSFSP